MDRTYRYLYPDPEHYIDKFVEKCRLDLRFYRIKCFAFPSHVASTVQIILLTIEYATIAYKTPSNVLSMY